MEKKIRTIPATLNKFTDAPVFCPSKRKTAGYARVSTDLEEQKKSYENQVDYYTNYIKSRTDWQFVKVYTDEGISATSTKHREGFNQMIQDALDGKIDLIITKSVSRFARNTVDTLVTVRKLKEKGVEVYFEKENIWTLDAKGELFITIMSSLAQEESHSISENTTWGRRKSFADGNASVPYSHFLGYDKDFKINTDEAKTVKMIYRLFLTGISVFGIAKELERLGRKTPFGKTKWCTSTIKSILTNEKYKGDALLQKEFTSDYLQKTIRKNNGEVPQHYVEGHHEPIIDPDTFDLVQVEIKKRYGGGKRYGAVTPFASRIKCGECGCWYGAKVWHSTDKYRRVVYRCNHKYATGVHCSTPHIAEEDLKALFVKAVGQLVQEREEALANIDAFRKETCDTSRISASLDKLETEIAGLENQIRELIRENAHVAQNQEEYNKRYGTLYELYDGKLKEKKKMEESAEKLHNEDLMIQDFLKKLRALDGEQLEFDETLWSGIVDCVTVYSREKVVFGFIGGIEITLGM